MTHPTAPSARPRRAGFLSDLTDRATYLESLYLLLSFPLGLAYFVFLVVGLSLGASLVVVWVGLPILLLVLAGLLAFADVERALAARLLAAPIRRFPRRPLSQGLWSWVREQLGDASTWKALLYLVLKFPFGLTSFVMLVVLLTLSVMLMVLPLVLLQDPQPLVFGDRHLTLPGMLALPVAGLGLLVLAAATARALGQLWRMLSVALLSDAGDSRHAQREVRALSRASSIVAFAGSLEETLGTLISQALDATDAQACVILRERDANAERRWQPCGASGLPDELTRALQSVYLEHEELNEELRAARAVIVRDVRVTWLRDARYAPTHPFMPQVSWDACVSLALVYRAERVGRLDVFFPAAGPSQRELEFLSALADQAAVAVENARLFSQVQEQASLQERQRLARELHDSVSQALYGVTLGVKTARGWLDRDPGRAQEPLEYALALAEGGTAEMKALLFALRPESLAQEGLVAALAKQAAVLSARYKLRVETDFGSEPDVPLGVKEALYRIAQEALHNTVKHARATEVHVKLNQSDHELVLDVRDDGQGFDPHASYPGHLGLHSMRERAQGIGALIALESAPGAGVHLRVKLPLEAA